MKKSNLYLFGISMSLMVALAACSKDSTKTNVASLSTQSTADMISENGANPDDHK